MYRKFLIYKLLANLDYQSCKKMNIPLFIVIRFFVTFNRFLKILIDISFHTGAASYFTVFAASVKTVF